MSQPTFSLTVRPDQIGVISMDVAGESMNVLKAAFADEIKSLLGEIKNNKDIKGLLLSVVSRILLSPVPIFLCWMAALQRSKLKTLAVWANWCLTSLKL